MNTQTDSSDKTVLLESSLGLAAAKPLADMLLGKRDTDVVLDASEIEHLGGACFQVLLSAQKTWRTDKMKFRIMNASPAFEEALIRFGYSKDIFLEQED